MRSFVGLLNPEVTENGVKHENGFGLCLVLHRDGWGTSTSPRVGGPTPRSPLMVGLDQT